MTMMTLNLTLLLVFQLSALQFLFGHREDLLYRISEFLRRLLLACRKLHFGNVS
jgi:hypothetical protein